MEETKEIQKQKPTLKDRAKAYLSALPKRYFITAFSGMAQGLFVTLIAGTILAQIAGWLRDNYLGRTLLYIANIAKSMMGAGIGVGIAYALGKNKLLVFSSAVASYRENKVGGLISQGIGTSMLQIPNIMKKPIIMTPMIISSAILGPLSTCVFKLKCGASGGGMGTSGLVGVFDLFKYTSGALGVIGIILLMLVLPALLNIVISEFMRKKGWIALGDMSLEM